MFVCRGMATLGPITLSTDPDPDSHPGASFLFWPENKLAACNRSRDSGVVWIDVHNDDISLQTAHTLLLADFATETVLGHGLKRGKSICTSQMQDKVRYKL